jgi:hypothetical protein
MSPSVRRPDERNCERCGRREQWDEAATSWRVADESGVAYCIHEWDINGSFLPFDDVEA